ncbi:hypothetical protein PIB30_029361 [Stylosanthes scabra]|uniref:Uncharacterized protein n=1 Tax=Stylosanthes scabra TaxID=79078 RepID=A0ABU6SBH2_9FABA|nr:hypothetical protein [Stylosanthes scabra]
MRVEAKLKESFEKKKKNVIARVKESLKEKAPNGGGSSGSSPQPKRKKQKETSYPEKKKRKKRKEPDEGMNKRIQKKKKGPDKVKEIKSSNLAGMLGELEKILHHHKGADAHLPNIKPQKVKNQCTTLLDLLIDPRFSRVVLKFLREEKEGNKDEPFV